MKSRIIFLALLALSCNNAIGEERLFVGRLESVFLVPNGTAACPSLTGSTQRADGSATVVISNNCGCQESKIAVDESLLGSSEDGMVTIRTRLGEWCQPTLPLSTTPILVHVNGGRLDWSRLEANGQDQLFQPKSFTLIAGVPVSSVPEVKAGFASLASLRKRLRDAGRN